MNTVSMIVFYMPYISLFNFWMNSSVQQIIEKKNLLTHLLITNINVLHKNANIDPDLFICVSNVDCDIGRICH